MSEASCPTSVPGVIWPLPPFWPVLLPTSPPVVPLTFPLFSRPLAGSCPRFSAPAVPFTWAALPALYLAAIQPLLPRRPLERSCLTTCLPLPLDTLSFLSSTYQYLQWYLFFSNPLPKMKTSDSTLCCLPLYPCAENAVWHLKVSRISVD